MPATVHHGPYLFRFSLNLQTRKNPLVQAPSDASSNAAGASTGANRTAGRKNGTLCPIGPDASLSIVKGSTVAKITALAAIGKRYRAKKTENGDLAAVSSKPTTGSGVGSSEAAGGEGALTSHTASRGIDGNRVGAAAGNGEGGGAWGSLLGKGTASGRACAEGEDNSVNTTTARGNAAAVQRGEGDVDGSTAGGVEVMAVETAAEVGEKAMEPASTSGDIGFEDEDEDCSWCIPEAAAPKAVWQGHIGPVTRIGSCGQPPAFFSLGEVCTTKVEML